MKTFLSSIGLLAIAAMFIPDAASAAQYRAPVYRAPVYRAPVYRAPARQVYRAPVRNTYRAPARSTYRAPARQVQRAKPVQRQVVKKQVQRNVVKRQAQQKVAQKRVQQKAKMATSKQKAASKLPPKKQLAPAVKKQAKGKMAPAVLGNKLGAVAPAKPIVPKKVSPDYLKKYQQSLVIPKFSPVRGAVVGYSAIGNEPIYEEPLGYQDAAEGTAGFLAPDTRRSVTKRIGNSCRSGKAARCNAMDGSKGCCMPQNMTDCGNGRYAHSHGCNWKPAPVAGREPIIPAPKPGHGDFDTQQPRPGTSTTPGVTPDRGPPNSVGGSYGCPNGVDAAGNVCTVR